MLCHCNASMVGSQPGADFFYAAKAIEPRQRQDLALQALVRSETICGLAAQHAVSRKFIYRQMDTAKEVFQEAFVPAQNDATKVLFYLPVTKQWLEQTFLGLALICHSSLRGISEFCRDLLDYPVSIGKVHDVLQGAVERARTYNHRQDLYATRRELYDFVVAELRARHPLCPHRIAPVVSALTNQGDDLLAFAAQLDQDLAGLAHRFQLPVATV